MRRDVVKASDTCSESDCLSYAVGARWQSPSVTRKAPSANYYYASKYPIGRNDGGVTSFVAQMQNGLKHAVKSKGEGPDT